MVITCIKLKSWALRKTEFRIVGRNYSRKMINFSRQCKTPISAIGQPEYDRIILYIELYYTLNYITFNQGFTRKSKRFG